MMYYLDGPFVAVFATTNLGNVLNTTVPSVRTRSYLAMAVPKPPTEAANLPQSPETAQPKLKLLSPGYRLAPQVALPRCRPPHRPFWNRGSRSEQALNNRIFSVFLVALTSNRWQLHGSWHRLLPQSTRGSSLEATQHSRRSSSSSLVADLGRLQKGETQHREKSPPSSKLDCSRFEKVLRAGLFTVRWGGSHCVGKAALAAPAPLRAIRRAIARLPLPKDWPRSFSIWAGS